MLNKRQQPCCAESMARMLQHANAREKTQRVVANFCKNAFQTLNPVTALKNLEITFSCAFLLWSLIRDPFE